MNHSAIQTQIHFERSLFGPDWRWQRAMADVNSNRFQPSHSVDNLTRRVSSYLRALCVEGVLPADGRYDDLSAAQHIWNDPLISAQVKLLVLANCSVDEIAGRLGLQESHINLVENLFFDVRPMLASTGWIVNRVIMEETDRGNDDLAVEMRLAFFAGPAAIRILLDAKSRLPADDTVRLVDSAILLHAKFQQACAMPLTAESTTEFLKLYLEAMTEEKQLEFQRQKLAFRMMRWSQRCELARDRAKNATDENVVQRKSDISAVTRKEHVGSTVADVI